MTFLSSRVLAPLEVNSSTEDLLSMTWQSIQVALMNAKKLAALFLFAASGAAAQAPLNVAPQASPSAAVPTAVRASHPPIIDGLDTDAMWQGVPRITGFRLFDPTEDADPPFATEARISYDDANLYVFVRAFDPRPDSILALLSRRDVKTASDQIKVMIDSYHDRRTGYEFAVNPAGVKRDFYTFDDSEEDLSWDAVWDVATRIDSLGWTAEFRIPLSQLRYPSASDHQFGIMIVRDIARRNERVSWPLLRRSKPGIASQFADVGGFVGLSSPRRIEISPYALTRNQSAVRSTGYARTQQATMGADIKYGITSNLTLDATVNPDFGQVEADPATLNLTAFETFLTEQRPFFLEGTGIFQFGNDPTAIFYSRRIGRAPQLSGLVTDENADVPGASRILGAGKLTGRLTDGTSLGVLGAFTERTNVGSTTIEPATTYGMARATRDFRGGESALGVVATTVHRSLDPATDPYLRSDALTAGIDGRHRFANGMISLRGSLATSTVRGTTSAITRTQRSGVHEYQRPDDGIAVDTSRTSLSGSSLFLAANKVSGLLRGGFNYSYVTPGYETNDLGYLSRADLQTLTASAQIVPSKPVFGWRNAVAGLYRHRAANRGRTAQRFHLGSPRRAATPRVARASRSTRGWTIRWRRIATAARAADRRCASRPRTTRSSTSTRIRVCACRRRSRRSTRLRTKATRRSGACGRTSSSVHPRA